jgi:hypothetical protein
MGSKAVSANTIDANRHEITDFRPARGDVDRLQIGRTAHQLARMASRPLQQNLELAPHAGIVEGPLLRLEQAV